jgi:3-deoxy-D-manno-octulosonic-acid transferase
VFPLKRLNAESAPAVMLIDKMGVLAELYERARVAFVGGSLRPFGGHNPAEPVLAGAPVLFGPYTEEQSDAADSLTEADLGVRVSDVDSLARAVIDAVRTPPDLEAWNCRRREFFAGFSGTARRVAMDIIKRLNSIPRHVSTETGDNNGEPLG